MYHKPNFLEFVYIPSHVLCTWPESCITGHQYSAEANMGSINDEQTNKTLPLEIKIKDTVLQSCP